MVTSTFFSADGDGYEAQMGRWSQRLAPLLVGFAGVTGGERVLDVGCGTGSLAFALAQNPKIGRVQGIDCSPAYVLHAGARALDPRLRFQVGDACALPYPDGAFDHALACLVLQFVPDADRAVREMRRVTGRGGTVAATTWDTRGGHVAYRMFFDTAAAIDRDAAALRAAACSRPMSRQGGLAQAWRRAGLLDIVEDCLSIRMEYASFSDYWLSIDCRNGPYAEYLDRLAAQPRARLRALVEAAYLDGDCDGPRSYAAIAWAVKGSVP